MRGFRIKVFSCANVNQLLNYKIMGRIKNVRVYRVLVITIKVGRLFYCLFNSIHILYTLVH